MSQKTFWGAVIAGAVLLIALVDAIATPTATTLGGIEPEEHPAEQLRWGFVDPAGQLVIDTTFEGARAFHEGRAAARSGGLWGWISPDGDWLLSPRFRQLCDHGPLSCAQDAESGLWGFIDPKGAWEIEPKFSIAHDMEDGVAVVGQILTPDGPKPLARYGLVSAAGEEVVPIRPLGDPEGWRSARPSREGLVPVQVKGLWGYVDTTGAWVIEPEFMVAKPFLEGYAGVSGSKGWAVIDRTGKIVVASGHGLADGRSEGLVSGADGYYTTTGEAVGARYEWVTPHQSGLGAVFVKQRWGFVDVEGEVIIEPAFHRVSPFTGDAAFAATLPEKILQWGIIDREGRWTVEPRWSRVDETGFHDGLGLVAEMR